MNVRRRLAIAVLLLAAMYLILEVVLTLQYVNSSSEPETFWIFENSGRTIHFDAIRGYRLTSIPSRTARITRGLVEYVGILRGNSQGFPDRDDFGPNRSLATTKRIAVFGDSFTAGLYLNRNWPDRVEDLFRDSGDTIELLNFSIDGGGLANWHNVLTRIVEVEDYEIDAVIFAVYPGDLRNGFVISEHRSSDRHLFGQVPSWDPETYPSTLDEASEYLRPKWNAYIISSEQFDRALRGEWRPARPFRLELADRIQWTLKRVRWFIEFEIVTDPKGFDPERMRLIEDILRYISAQSLPVMVVNIPTKGELISDDSPATSAETEAFAAILRATFLDGTSALANVSHDSAPAYWFPFDGHWNQLGSDRFAEFMAEILVGWP